MWEREIERKSLCVLLRVSQLHMHPEVLMVILIGSSTIKHLKCIIRADSYGSSLKFRP